MLTVMTLILLSSPELVQRPAASQGFRPQKYALFQAHKILPPTLSKLVKMNGKHLFQGFDRGIAHPPQNVSAELIEREKRRITELVDQRAPFRQVIAQMGYVGGLLAIYLDPSLEGSHAVQKGFPYYLNLKLPKFLFVFDGYDAMQKARGGSRGYLNSLASFRNQHARILEVKYGAAGQNPYHRFSEQSAVFGVSSLYFSNLAATSAHLWYDAWQAANGDIQKTPYKGIQRTPTVIGRGERK